jgi:protein-S-isoprenylcysteine O-methyltransferase Ste14
MDETNHQLGDDDGSIRIHPPALAGILLLAGLIIHLLGSHHRFHHHGAAHFHQLAGLLMVAVGVGLSFYAAAIFAARDTTKDPYGQPAALVTIAPFTFTRNPMYLGLTIILFGFAIFFFSPAMLLAPLVFFVVIDRVIIPKEEQALERSFGSSYLDYQRRVRRWL